MLIQLTSGGFYETEVCACGNGSCRLSPACGLRRQYADREVHERGHRRHRRGEEHG